MILDLERCSFISITVRVTGMLNKMRSRVHILDIWEDTYNCEKEHADLVEVPMSVISQSNEQWRIAAITFIIAIISQIKDEMNDSLRKVILLSDACWLQFPSKFVFALVTHYENLRLSTGSVQWMELVKRVVFDLIKSNKITINSAEELEREALRTVLSIKFRKIMRLLSHRLSVLPLKSMTILMSIMWNALLTLMECDF